MASMTARAWPLVTLSPALTANDTTLPGTLGSEHVNLVAQAVQGQHLALSAKLQREAFRVAFVAERARRLAAYRQAQGAVMQVGQLRRLRLAMELKGKAAHIERMRAPAIALAERV